MSVGGDGKGKHEKEPDPSQNESTGSDEDVVDIPPYDAVTEVMRAIDPNEPPPGSAAPSVDPTSADPEPADPEPAGPELAAATPVGPISDDSASEPPVPDDEPVPAGPEIADVEPVDPALTESAAEETVAEESTAGDPETVVDETLVDESRPGVASTEIPDHAAPVAAEVGPAESVVDYSPDQPTQAYSALAPEDQISSAPGDDALWPEDVDSSAPTVAQQAVEPVPASGSAGGDTSSRVKIAVIAGAAVAILGVFYAADMLSSSGSVPRGVTVAGIEIGGLGHDDAEARLQSELAPRVDEPVRVDAGDQELELVPAAAGLGVDWAATLDRAGSQPINPFTRLASFFTQREIGVQSTVDTALLDGAVETIRAQTDRETVEGDVVFEGATPVGITPVPGQSVDVLAARDEIESNWSFGTVEVPVETVDVAIHQEEVDRALAEVATPAVSAPVVFEGRDDARAVLAPEGVAAILAFEPDGQGALEPRYDIAAATGQLAPQLASTETPPKDATFALGGGAPTVVPAVVGELVQWPKTLEELPMLLASNDSRTTDAVYEQAQPELTTEGAEALGIEEVIGEYTTGGFEYASGVNIRLTANIVNGALVKPGETFSLNEYTGPRGTAQGFVESGIIDNGRPDRAVGGGISQFATTLYNASYFSGMEDAGHTEHSYYISRYPEAREATVFEGAIDLKFTNTGETGVVIESSASSSDVTVRLWGTKTVDVQSITGPRTNPTSPNTITLPAGSACVPSSGGPGFTASDTRVVTDIASGNEVSRNTRTVRYDPIPIVRCASPEPAPAPEPESDDEPPADTPPNEDDE